MQVAQMARMCVEQKTDMQDTWFATILQVIEVSYRQ